MPLLVHCPNRCQIRVPSNRMGKVIRCVDCQTPIIIPEVESPLLRTGNWVECRAKRAIKKTEISNAYTADSQQGNTEVSPVDPAKAQASILPLVSPTRTVRLLRAKPWRTVEPLTEVDPEDVLTPIELDDPPSPEVCLAQTRPAEPPTDHSDTNDNVIREHAKDHVPEIDPRQPSDLPMFSRFLCFVNPFAKGPRRPA